MPGWPLGPSSPPIQPLLPRTSASAPLVLRILYFELSGCDRSGETGAQPHYWVATLDSLRLDREESDSGQNLEVLFWEPLTSQQFSLPVLSRRHFFAYQPLCDPATEVSSSSSSNHIRGGKHPFCQLFALFRPDCIAISVQPRPSVAWREESDYGSAVESDRICFDLRDARFWSRLPNPHYALLKHPGSALLPCLVHSPLVAIPESFGGPTAAQGIEDRDSAEKEQGYGCDRDARERSLMSSSLRISLEERVESAVRDAVASMRADVGLTSLFDAQLALCLQASSLSLILSHSCLPLTFTLSRS